MMTNISSTKTELYLIEFHNVMLKHTLKPTGIIAVRYQMQANMFKNIMFIVY